MFSLSKCLDLSSTEQIYTAATFKANLNINTFFYKASSLPSPSSLVKLLNGLRNSKQTLCNTSVETLDKSTRGLEKQN